MRQYKTPLRYPGGKQRLSPFILELIVENNLLGCDYVEPYAGGAGVALELLCSNKVKCIHLNDSSYPIYAFWKAVTTQPEEFCHRIKNASLTVDDWKKHREIVKSPKAYDLFEVGYSTFYLNRCNRSGVLSGGLIGGLAQKGDDLMDARFPINELIRRIDVIASKKESIHIYNKDAEDFIVSVVPNLPANTFVYCDPPYFNKSEGLYLNRYKKQDHARLAKVIQENLVRDWVVSYDSAPEILDYYSQRNFFIYDLKYNAARVYYGKEVFIFSDSIRLPRRSSLPFIDKVIAS